MISAMSTKHQPNPKKRPIDHVTPEFPALPLSSLEAVKEFARKSQEALSSVPSFSANIHSFFLPLISPHPLQFNLNVKEDSVFVIMRKSYPLLKNEIESFRLERYQGICLRGPCGIGKSYLLYLLAAEYRLNRERYRVTYINDCKMWRYLPYHYLLRELVTTFYDDNIEGKSILEWCREVDQSWKKELMNTMINALIDSVRQRNLEWIIICDQYNELLPDDFQFKLIDTIFSANIKKIIGVTARNEEYPYEIAGWHTYDLSSHCFDQEEFKVWCDHYLLEDNIKIDHESEEAMDAFFWTGGIPRELNWVWKQPKNSLIEKIKMYRKERFNEMRESHVKFFKSLAATDKLELDECVSRMALGLSPPKELDRMDKQLFRVVANEDGNETMIALNPLARRALLHYHAYGQSIVTSLGFVVKCVFNGRTDEAKDRILKNYITAILEISKQKQFKFQTRTTATRMNPDLKEIHISEIVHFPGNKLPHDILLLVGDQQCLFQLLQIILDLIFSFGMLGKNN